eukprot:41155_1
MHNTSWCFILLYMHIFAIFGALFVNQNGVDNSSCGIERRNACGSLLFASKLLNSNQTEIYVIDGQNEEDIGRNINHTNNSYHPCLPMLINETFTNITITFDENIVSMLQWYPQICVQYDIDNHENTNQYMFETFGVETLTINNLNIDFTYYTRYQSQTQRGIIGVVHKDRSFINDSVLSHLVCNNCNFRNIYNSNLQILMIYSTSFVKFQNSFFTNINSVTPFISGYDGIQIHNSHITNSTLNHSFIVMKFQSITNAQESKNVILMDCVFENIRTKTSIIESLHTFGGYVSMNNVDFRNINEGGIYQSADKARSDAYIKNINISTTQLATLDQTSLLYFHYSDTVDIENLHIHYYYDLNTNCEYGFPLASNDLIQASYVVFDCKNPISLITNPGSLLTMKNIYINIDISQNDTQLFRQQISNFSEKYDYILMQYISVQGQLYYNSIIRNLGTLEINNITIYGLPPADIFIENYKLLEIHNMNIIIDEYYYQYDPNTLQSSALILQVNRVAETVIYNSNLSAAQRLMFVHSGSLTIRNSTLHHANNAIETKSAQNVTVSGCQFSEIGRYWSNIKRAAHKEFDLAIVNLRNVEQTILFEYNRVTGFENCCCSLFLTAIANFDNNELTTAIIRNNIFVVNADNLYYNITKEKQCEFNSPSARLLLIENTKYLSIIENNFSKNDIFPQIHWLGLRLNGQIWYGGYACLSANNFTNRAFWLLGTHPTSCYRKSLSYCIDNICNDGEYGIINPKLNRKISHFNIDIDANIKSFFTIYYSWITHYVAMDNIQINVFKNGSIITNETDKHWNFYIKNVYLLIMDSVFSSVVNVLYDDNCSVEENDRLVYDTTHIAKLILLCPYNADNSYYYLNNSFNYVDHFSLTHFQFTPKTATYYPGQRLEFSYALYDRLNNNYTDWFSEENISNTTIDLMINLESESYFLNQDVDITDDECNVCNSGLIIFGVDLNHTLAANNTNRISIQTSLEDTIVVLTEDIIELSIIACPIGWGADSKKYQCNVCPKGTYNLSPNNTKPCKSCNENKNTGVICFDGEVFIRRNYWLGFQDNNETIVTSQCPSRYCCVEEVCNYTHKSTLCAQNRDNLVPLCGACRPGFTEAINTVECMICDEYDYIWLVKPMILAICYVLYLSMCHPMVSIKQTEMMLKLETDVERSSCLNICYKMKNSWTKPHFMMLVKTLILRILLYYQQTLGYILWPTASTPYMPYMIHIISLFDLEPSVAHDNPKPVCLFDKLTSKSKILLGLLPWGVVLALLLIIFPIHYATTFFDTGPTKCPKFCIINYRKAILAFLIICVGQILAVCFKLLTCRKVGSIRVHFYFGSELCNYFQTETTIVAIIIIFVVVVIFFIMWIQLYLETQEEREDPNYYLNQLCKYYKPDCYYWEFLILTRRIIIALFAVFYTWIWFRIVLITVLLIFLGLQYKFQPFRAVEANFAESMSLGCLIIVVGIESIMTQNNSLIEPAAIIITLFIIVPIITVIIFLFLYTQCPMKQDIANNYPISTTTLSLRPSGDDATKNHSNEEKTVEMQFTTNNTTHSGNKLKICSRGMYQPTNVMESESGSDGDTDDTLSKEIPIINDTYTANQSSIAKDLRNENDDTFTKILPTQKSSAL